MNVPVENCLVILKPALVNVKKQTVSVFFVLYLTCISGFGKSNERYVSGSFSFVKLPLSRISKGAFGQLN